MARTILYFSTEDFAFCQHFMVMGQAASSVDLAVTVATRVRAHGQRIIDAGFRLIPIQTDRGGLRFTEAFFNVIRMAGLIRRERPSIVQCMGLRMVLLAGLAARIGGAKQIILAPTGLGHLWISQGWKERVLRIAVRFVIGKVLRGRRLHFVFENRDDPVEFGISPDSDEVTIIGGVGVSANEFPAVPMPPGDTVKVAIVSRMLVPKGIREAVDAVLIARHEECEISLHLFGVPDPANPTSFTEADLLAWTQDEGIVWHGRADSITEVWKQHHIAMLLSYREGLPVSLVEAAASARPIVTTDVVGCREVVRDGIEGFLVPRGDSRKAAERLMLLARDVELRNTMGQAAYQRFSDRFKSDIVEATMKSLYTRLIEDRTT
jgi:glycosyltransferase involved in cell wall biosynthesis